MLQGAELPPEVHQFVARLAHQLCERHKDAARPQHRLEARPVGVMDHEQNTVAQRQPERIARGQMGLVRPRAKDRHRRGIERFLIGKSPAGIVSQRDLHTFNQDDAFKERAKKMGHVLAGHDAHRLTRRFCRRWLLGAPDDHGRARARSSQQINRGEQVIPFRQHGRRLQGVMDG